jgi:hypothetical protein
MRAQAFGTTATLMAVLLAAASLTAGARRPQASPRTVLDVMLGTTVPASTAIFDVTEPPKTPAEWQALAKHATAIIDSGALLLAPSRARDKGQWVTEVRRHVEDATRVVKAAEKKDFDAYLAASDSLAESCVNCHKVYLSR